MTAEVWAVSVDLKTALDSMKAAKPNDRSELDRRIAICVTELEKIVANWHYWVTQRQEKAED